MTLLRKTKKMSFRGSLDTHVKDMNIFRLLWLNGVDGCSQLGQTWPADKALGWFIRHYSNTRAWKQKRVSLGAYCLANRCWWWGVSDYLIEAWLNYVIVWIVRNASVIDLFRARTQLSSSVLCYHNNLINDIIVYKTEHYPSTLPARYWTCLIRIICWILPINCLERNQLTRIFNIIELAQKKFLEMDNLNGGVLR